MLCWKTTLYHVYFFVAMAKHFKIKQGATLAQVFRGFGLYWWALVARQSMMVPGE